VWWSTKARDYEALLVLGLASLLCALRLVENCRSRRDWLVLGLVVGLGWWTNPQIAYLAVPAALWVVIADRPALRHGALAIPGFLIGSFPWIAWNVANHWASLHSQFPATEGYLAHLARFWREGLPTALGLRYVQRWMVPHGSVVLVLVVAGAVASLLTRRKGAVFLSVALVTYPLIHAIMPVASYTGEGRYLYLFSPVLALLVAHAARNRALVAVAFVLMAALSVGQLATMGEGDSGMASNLAPPTEMGPLVHSLQAEGIKAVYSDYWIAYRLTFLTGEKIIAMGVPINRYEPYEQRVRQSPRSAWVYVAGSIGEQHFTAALDALRVPYRTLRPGKWAIHIPARPVRPEEVPVT
jgi:hypothetical protein